MGGRWSRTQLLCELGLEHQHVTEYQLDVLQQVKHKAMGNDKTRVHTNGTDSDARWFAQQGLYVGHNGGQIWIGFMPDDSIHKQDLEPSNTGHVGQYMRNIYAAQQ